MKHNTKITCLVIMLLMCSAGCQSNSGKTTLVSQSTTIQQNESASSNIIYGDLNINELESLANNGDVKAQFQLGLSYQLGEKVDMNGQKAVEWYSKAAEQGYTYAQYNLGSMYYNGDGVEQNFQEAFKWYSKAAENGDSSAQRVLGRMYYDGDGTEQNTEEAIKWLTKAADQDNEEAKELLKEIESSESST